MSSTNSPQSYTNRKIWIPPPALTSSGSKSRNGVKTSSKKSEKCTCEGWKECEDNCDLREDVKMDTKLKNILLSIQKLKDEISTKNVSEKQLQKHEQNVSAMTITLEKVRDIAEEAVQKLQNVQTEKAKIKNALESVQKDLLTKADDNQKLTNQRDILSSRLKMVEESANEAIKSIVPIGEFIRKINASQENKMEINENCLQEITAKLLHLVKMNKLVSSPIPNGGGDDLKATYQQNGHYQLKQEIENLQMRLQEDRAKIDDLQKSRKKVGEPGITEKEKAKSALRIQKERANKYLGIIETLKAQIFQQSSEINQLNSEVNCLKLHNCQLKTENDRVEVEKSTLYRELIKNNSQVSNKEDMDRARIEDMTNKLSQSVSNIAFLESEKLDLQKNLSKANLEIEQLKLEINKQKIDAKFTSVKNTQTNFSKGSDKSESSQKDAIFGKAIWEELKSDKMNIIQSLKDLEKKLEISQQTNSEFRKEISSKEDALNQIHLKLQNKIDENQSLRQLLESALNDVKKYSNFVDQKAVLQEQANGSRISELEKQLFDCRHERDQLFREMSEMELRCINQIKEMQERLELAEKSKSTMQDYVRFLKTSYANVFSDCLTSHPFKNDL